MNRGSVQYIEQELWNPGGTFPLDNEDITSRDDYNSLQHAAEEVTDVAIITAKDPRSLPFFKASLFCAMLEDALVEMQILEQCNNSLKIIKLIADMKHRIALKFGVAQPAVTDELEGIDHRDLNNTVYKIKKLDADRKLVNDVMLKLYLELAFNATFYSLKEFNKQWLDDITYRADLITEEARNKINRKELARQVRHQRNHFKSVIYDSDVKIEHLKSQVEDFILVSETSQRYVANWEIARTEQHIKTIEDVETPPLTQIACMKQKYEHEVRVHNEVELVVNIIINETLGKVEEWMDKYDRDSEALDLKIQIKKHEYDDARRKKLDMEAMLAKHAQMIKEWVAFKEERERIRQYRMKMTKAAIVVQAWWRGLLVRCQLGPYKPKKGKKKEKK